MSPTSIVSVVKTDPVVAVDLLSLSLPMCKHFFGICSQELAPHTSPIFVSAFRLLPAGVALVSWAAASGRKQPQGWQAWFACALFGLVDGTAFQVRPLLPMFHWHPTGKV